MVILPRDDPMFDKVVPLSLVTLVLVSFKRLAVKPLHQLPGVPYTLLMQEIKNCCLKPNPSVVLDWRRRAGRLHDRPPVLTVPSGLAMASAVHCCLLTKVAGLSMAYRVHPVAYSACTNFLAKLLLLSILVSYSFFSFVIFVAYNCNFVLS